MSPEESKITSAVILNDITHFNVHFGNNPLRVFYNTKIPKFENRLRKLNPTPDIKRIIGF